MKWSRKGVFVTCVVFQVYVLKRPYVDEFLQKMGELFECVLFTASLAKVGSTSSSMYCTYGNTTAAVTINGNPFWCFKHYVVL